MFTQRSRRIRAQGAEHCAAVRNPCRTGAGSAPSRCSIRAFATTPELPMTISMHAASVPLFTRGLGNLAHCLDQGVAYAAQRRFEPRVLLESRLYPDMLPLTKQVQIACDTAKYAVARLAGVEAPRHDDHETTVDELKDRIARTVAYLKTVPAAQIDGSEARPIEVPVRQGDPLRFSGLGYLQEFALPNFYFHLTTAYALLRHNGVPLGKADFLRGAR